jgi:hypothetical protein
MRNHTTFLHETSAKQRKVLQQKFAYHKKKVREKPNNTAGINNMTNNISIG